MEQSSKTTINITPEANKPAEFEMAVVQNPKIERCLSVKTGAFIIALISILFYTFALVLNGIFLVSTKNPNIQYFSSNGSSVINRLNGSNMNKFLFSAVGSPFIEFLSYLIGIIVCILILIAHRYNKRAFYVPYLIYMPFCIVRYALFAIILIILAFNFSIKISFSDTENFEDMVENVVNSSQSLFVTVGTITIMVDLVLAYFWYVVFCAFKNVGLQSNTNSS